MSTKTLSRPLEAPPPRRSPHELATERKSLLERLEDVQLAIDVAKAFATDEDDGERSPCMRAVLSLCGAVQALSDAVKNSRRTNGGSLR